jgi:hypothetical protein
MVARHPVKRRADAFWVVAGRVVDWGPLPGADELAARTAEALERSPARGPVPPDEVDEVRIVSTWTADHELLSLPLDPPPEPETLLAFAK